ncbi:MAG: hypothetical protein GQ575_07345 [Deltaproteobacteria bacterium]|nr:hypothetical protein [Deltaproteobacteria bacterium]
MSEQDRVRLREMLLNQRQEIFEQYQRFEFDLQALGERDVENVELQMVILENIQDRGHCQFI